MSSSAANQQAYGRRRKSPYMVAIVLAMVMFILVAPEVNDGDAMSPTINDGQILVVSKTSYSQNRGIPNGISWSYWKRTLPMLRRCRMTI